MKTNMEFSLALPFMLALSVGAAVHGGEGKLLRFIEPSPNTGTSRAVVVGDTALAHTGQLLPLDSDGKLVGKDDSAAQLDQVLANLRAALNRASTGFDSLVKLNVYAADASMVHAVQSRLATEFTGRAGPAVTFVESELPLAGALLAIDAVAASPSASDQTVRFFTSESPARSIAGAEVAVLPSGGRIYVSGQAERAETLGEATRKTMEGLERTLRHRGTTWSEVVQLKAFFQPMSDAAVVRSEIASFFPERSVPTLVLVEWESLLPIEIELVAAAPEDPEAERLSFVTPPGMTRSPIFSRVARLPAGRTIYLSGLYGDPTGAPADDPEEAAENEVRQIFSELERLLPKAGSDFRHLAKATYYVSNTHASNKLNEVRPDYYDPQRPPAASKAMVRGVGVNGRGITVDLIAVPAR